MLPGETPRNGTSFRGVSVVVPGGTSTPGKGTSMLDLQVGIHVFMTVLVLGTIWRVTQYHLMASPNPGIQHIGKAMSTQY